MSNTNALHYKFVRKNFGIVKEFKESVLSYKVGHRKPDLRIFKALLIKTGRPANNHIYIDDIGEHVEIAESIGMVGITFKSAEQLQKELKKNGISF